MTRAELRTFLKAGVDSLEPATDFGYGLITDFNSSRSNQYPKVWWETDPGTLTDIPNQLIPIDSIPVVLRIAQLDKFRSTPDVYEPLIDTADEVGRQLIYQYNNLISGYKLLTITQVKRTPLVQKFADCLTGITLSFTITGPDKTAVCT